MLFRSKGSRGAIPRMAFLVESLTDKRKNAAVEKLEAVAKSLSCTPAQLAIAWCLCNPRVSTVITGASRIAQVKENMKAAEVAERIDADTRGRIEATTAFEFQYSKLDEAVQLFERLARDGA